MTCSKSHVRDIFFTAIVSLIASGLLTAQDASQKILTEHLRRASAARNRKDYPDYLSEMRQVLEVRPNQPAYMYHLAGAYTLTGNRTEGLNWLRRVAEMGMIYPAAGDPDLSSLNDSEEFNAILKLFDQNRVPHGSSTRAFVVNQKGLIPEGIAFDPKSGDYFIGSVRKREILRIDRSGNSTVFADSSAGLWAVMGMKVDARRHVLWVTSSALPEMEMFRPEEEGFAGVFAFDLRNGNLIRSYVLANDTQKHALGDLTLTKSGVVYATDSLSPAIYRTSSKLKHLELFLDKGPFVSPQGVAFSPDEKRMFVADYPLGVFAVEVKTKKYFQLPAPANVAITGVDGLYYYRGALIGIQNGTSPNRLVRFRLNASQDRIESAEVLEVNNPDFDEPSLAVLDHDVIYYNANSQWGKVNKDHQLPPETDLSNLIVLKLKL